MHIRVLCLAVLLAAPLMVSADSHDFSLWTKYSGGELTHIPWYSYSRPGELGLSSFALDLRYNMDLPEHLGVFAGVPITKGKLCVTPYAGFILGSQVGLSGQVTTFVSAGKLSSYSLNQYAILEHGDDNFAYHYGDLMTRIHKRVALGFSEQVFKESGDPASLDLGPAIKFMPGRGLYAKLWVTASPTDDWRRKAFLGIGFAP